MMTADTNETTLAITRLFDAPPARVFDAWLKREEWQSWIGPEGMSCEVPVLEPRVGGRYRLTMNRRPRARHACGVFLLVEGAWAHALLFRAVAMRGDVESLGAVA